MRESWRWFGYKDPITLSEIKETGASEVVTALHHIRCGDLWPEQDITKVKQDIESAGLIWRVVESLPVHESIKQNASDAHLYIDTYLKNMRILAKNGIEVICYNFMPITDWTRTSIDYKQDDGSITLEFNPLLYIIYDLFLLKREGAEQEYSIDDRQLAKKRYEELTKDEIDQLIKVIGMGLPGTVDDLSLEAIKSHINSYKNITESTLRENYISFLKQIIPEAERLGLKMAVHPDDPPVPILGLPRIVSSKTDLQQLFESVPSLNNGLTLCIGSLGAGVENDLIDITKTFAERVHFIHFRNVSHLSDPNDKSHKYPHFIEAPHLTGDQNIVELIDLLIKEEDRRNSSIPFRPDHGMLMLTDKKLQESRAYYPGYSLIGRLKGLAEIRGVIYALNSIKKIEH